VVVEIKVKELVSVYSIKSVLVHAGDYICAIMLHDTVKYVCGNWM
jgi:hypothetical protein